MVTVTVNGDSRQLKQSTTVAELVEAMQLPSGSNGVAVAIDAEVVPRSNWQTATLKDGVEVEVLTAVQGG